MVDSVQGIADLVAFGQEQRQVEQIEALNRRLNHLQVASAYVSGLQGSLINLLENLTAWTMLLVALPLVVQGQFNGIFLALLVLASLASFEIVLPLPATFQQIGGNLQAARRLFEIVDATPVVQGPLEASPQPVDYTIEVEHLSFRYSPQEPVVLEDINLSLVPGKALAVVGPSGSGKSTLAHVLLRYWDYQHGKITFGGHDLRAYRQEDLYRYVSVIEQDTHLFNTTIRENLRLARPNATEEELVVASKRAQLHDFVLTLPAGYDTQVGEQGLRLSGGECQRVAIARAFLKNAPILILDEPTVNLDAINEQAVLQALDGLRKDRSTFIITHRLVAMEFADEILLLQDGHVIERGTHQALLQHEGSYWRMWQQQQATTTNVK
jgi:ATP-binding cassette subfamily C protein CydC